MLTRFVDWLFAEEVEDILKVFDKMLDRLMVVIARKRDQQARNNAEIARLLNENCNHANAIKHATTVADNIADLLNKRELEDVTH